MSWFSRTVRRSWPPFHSLGTLVICCVLTLARPALAQPADPFADLIQRAQAARAAGDLEACLDLLGQAYQLKPSPELLNNRGKVLEDLGRYEEAAKAYKGVADDPAADPNLRSLDASRFAALQAKLNRSWLLVKLTPPDAAIWVNGTASSPSAGSEIPGNPGRNVVEMSSPGSSVIVVRRPDLPAGRRTLFREDLTQPKPTDSAIALAPGLGTPLSLSIDGYALRTELGGRTALRVDAGVYEVAVELVGGERFTETVRVPPASQVFVGEQRVREQPAADPVTPVEPPTPAAAAEPWKRSIWPYVVGGVGLALAGVGTWLLVDAEADRDQVRDAKTEARALATGSGTVVTGVTYARAVELEESANNKTGAGAAVVGIGAAAVVGSVVWWLLDAPADPPSDSSGLNLQWGPTSVGVSGRF
jgi:tetratricopeptide (TPR) repeat protein